MRRGASNSPDIPYRFNPLFGVVDRVADSQPYKAVDGIAKEANTWNQLERNAQPQQRRELLRELASRNSGLANSLKSDITKGTLRFYDYVGNLQSMFLSHSQRLNVAASSRPKNSQKHVI